MNDTMQTMNATIRTLGVRMHAGGGTRTRNEDGWEHDRYRVKLTREGRSMTLTYRMGTGHYGSPPTLDLVLDCLASDAAGVENSDGFEDWALDYGYDPDSRKAESFYRAGVKQTDDLRRLLGDDGFNLLVWQTERA